MVAACFAILTAGTVAAGVPAGDVRKPRAQDVAVEAGIDLVTRSWSVSVADFDANGWPDVLLGVHGDGPARLYRNDQGHFVEVGAGTFVDRDRHDCAWGDANVDARPDIYCTIGAESGHGMEPNELWIQQPEGSFVDEAAAFGVTDPYGRGRRTTFIDVNHDALPDLFVGNAYPRADEIPSPNRLFINGGGTSFRDAPEYGLDFEMGARCVQAVDFDEDGWQDLLVCGQPGDGLRLFRNMEGTVFHDVTEAVGIADDSNSAVLVDLSGDDRLDLVFVTSTKVQMQLADGEGFAPPVAVRAGLPHPRWLAAGDVNRDGRIDLYVLNTCGVELNEPDVMLLNAGDGRFADTRIPQTTEGCGDVVAPIDYDRNGNTDFVVMNGIFQNPDYKPEGPVQLIAFRGPR
jgi:FG-GAP-like repeat